MNRSNWQSQKPWRSSRLASGAGRQGLALLGLGAVVAGLAMPATLAIPEELDKGNWLILTVLLFDLVALALWVGAIREFWAWKTFGEIYAVLAPWPGQAGGDVAGHFELRKTLPEDHLIEVELVCLQHRRQSKNNTASPVWAQTRPLLGLKPHERQIWFQFEVPEALPESSRGGRRWHVWSLRLRIRMPGPNLDRRYEIPVFPGTQRNRLASRNMRLNTQLADQKLQAEFPIFRRHDGISLGFGPGRHWKIAIPLACVGLACLIASVPLWLDGGLTRLMAVMFGLFGVPLSVASLVALGLGRRVRLTGTELAIRLSWFGLPILIRRAAREQIRRLSIRHTSSVQGGSTAKRYFSLNAELAAGGSLVLCRGLDGEDFARSALAALARESGLPTD